MNSPRNSPPAVPAKRAPRCSPAFGRCPDCTTPLQYWGIDYDPRGAITSQFGCPMCERLKFQRHELACRCADCARGVDKLHRVEPVLPAALEAAPPSGKPTPHLT